MYLNPSALETPVIAVGAAAREAPRLADVLENTLQALRDVFEGDDRRHISETKRLDDVLDKPNTAIKAYLTSLDPKALSDVDHRRVTEILATATNMEQAGDIRDKNLLGLAAKKLKRGLAFSKEGQAQLLTRVDRLMAVLRAAGLLAAEKEAFRNLEAVATASHFERLRNGRVDTAETSSLHRDALRHIKQTNTHLVAAAAYPVLVRKGELLPNRLRKEE